MVFFRGGDHEEQIGIPSDRRLDPIFAVAVVPERLCFLHCGKGRWSAWGDQTSVVRFGA